MNEQIKKKDWMEVSSFYPENVDSPLIRWQTLKRTLPVKDNLSYHELYIFDCDRDLGRHYHILPIWQLSAADIPKALPENQEFMHSRFWSK